jgi:hypothetical protein
MDIKARANVQARLSSPMAINMQKWKPLADYIVGDTFLNSGIEHLVVSDHTSALVFDSTIPELKQKVEVEVEKWPDIGWLTPTHSGATNTEVITVDDVDAITSIEYELRDSVSGVLTAMVWDATTFIYGTNGFYGDNVTNNTYTLSRDGFFNVFVKRSPTEFHILANANGAFQEMRSLKINGVAIREVTGEEHVQQAIDNIPDTSPKLIQSGRENGNGNFQVITFNTPFATAPNVVASCINNNLRQVAINAITTTDFTCRTMDSNQTSTASEFSWIATT